VQLLAGDRLALRPGRPADALGDISLAGLVAAWLARGTAGNALTGDPPARLLRRLFALCLGIITPRLSLRG